VDPVIIVAISWKRKSKRRRKKKKGVIFYIPEVG
jgi:hypothetical protein